MDVERLAGRLAAKVAELEQSSRLRGEAAARVAASLILAALVDSGADPHAVRASMDEALRRWRSDQKPR
ncbi:MAG: hypothetical protein ACRDZ4_00735 [Egibacteraceae bacterium]